MRVKVALAFLAPFLVVICLNIMLQWPLFPVLFSVVTVCCLAELNSLSAKARVLTAKWALFVQLLITLMAAATAWLATYVYPNWPLAILAIAVPVVSQNMAAYYIGRFWLPRDEARPSLIGRFLSWYHFKCSQKKTFGVLVVSSAIALLVSLICFSTSPLLISIAALSSVSAAAGDLLESRLKRLTGVKDSGELLRGGRSAFASLERAIASHGGFLDRFDSLSFCAAVSFIPLIIFAL